MHFPQERIAIERFRGTALFAFDQGGESDDALALASDVQYMTGAWQLGPDEMLLIEGRPPEAPYWMIQIMDRWLDTADFRRRRVHLNDAQVELEADGSYRIAVSPRDPGLPNWLDTGGRREGYMAFRWVLATGVEPPTVRRVPIAEGR